MRHELAALGNGLHPPVPPDIAHALYELAARTLVPTGVSVDGTAELPAGHRAALWFICAEALANVDKHAAATTASRDGADHAARGDRPAGRRWPRRRRAAARSAGDRRPGRGARRPVRRHEPAGRPDGGDRGASALSGGRGEPGRLALGEQGSAPDTRGSAGPSRAAARCRGRRGWPSARSPGRRRSAASASACSRTCGRWAGTPARPCASSS